MKLDPRKSRPTTGYVPQVAKALSNKDRFNLQLCRSIGEPNRHSKSHSWKTLARRSVAWYSVRVNARYPYTQSYVTAGPHPATPRGRPGSVPRLLRQARGRIDSPLPSQRERGWG